MGSTIPSVGTATFVERVRMRSRRPTDAAGQLSTRSRELQDPKPDPKKAASSTQGKNKGKRKPPLKAKKAASINPARLAMAAVDAERVRLREMERAKRRTPRASPDVSPRRRGSPTVQGGAPGLGKNRQLALPDCSPDQTRPETIGGRSQRFHLSFSEGRSRRRQSNPPRSCHRHSQHPFALVLAARSVPLRG